MLTTCSFSAPKSAADGTVDYGTSCQTKPVSFTSTISVPKGLTVDVEANGHSVTFDGDAKVRLFEVTGGKQNGLGGAGEWAGEIWWPMRLWCITAEQASGIKTGAAMIHCRGRNVTCGVGKPERPGGPDRGGSTGVSRP